MSDTGPVKRMFPIFGKTAGFCPVGSFPADAASGLIFLTNGTQLELSGARPPHVRENPGPELFIWRPRTASVYFLQLKAPRFSYSMWVYIWLETHSMIWIQGPVAATHFKLCLDMRALKGAFKLGTNHVSANTLRQSDQALQQRSAATAASFCLN